MLLVHHVIHGIPHVANDVGITRQIALREDPSTEVVIVVDMALVDLHIERPIGVGTEHHVGEGVAIVVDVKGSHFVFLSFCYP